MSGCVFVCLRQRGFVFEVILFQQGLSVDVSEAAQESQGGQCVGVGDPNVTRHPLDQTREALQLGHHVV